MIVDAALPWIALHIAILVLHAKIVGSLRECQRREWACG